MQLPAQMRRLRWKPLPEDVVILLKIASGDDDLTRRAAAKVGRTTTVVREAAEFFIVQILFAPDADSYRILGAKPDASAGELRRNVALLLRWLHPDVDPKGECSMFATRVTRAWNDLKTPERRAAYNQRQALRNPLAQKSRLKTKAPTAKPKQEASTVRSARGSDARPVTRRLTRVYAPRRVGFLQRLLLHLLGRPIL